MSRLDLSGWLYEWTKSTHSKEENNQCALLMEEALRAQRSEDELKERVRVLEDAIRAHRKVNISEPCGIAQANADSELIKALAGGKEGGV